MVCRRVALVTALLAAASCTGAKKESSEAPNLERGALGATSGTAIEKTRGANDKADNKPIAPGPMAGSASANQTTTNAAREQTRADGIVGPTDNRAGSDFKSGFADEEKRDGAHEGKTKPVTATPTAKKSTGARVEIATLEGNPDPRLKSQIEAHLAELGACYDTARAKTPGLHGRLDLSFSVQGDGTIVAPMVASTSTTQDRTLGGCVVGIVAKLALDKVATPPIKGVLVIAFGQ